MYIVYVKLNLNYHKITYYYIIYIYIINILCYYNLSGFDIKINWISEIPFNELEININSIYNK